MWEKGRRVKFGKMEEGLRVEEKGQGQGVRKGEGQSWEKIWSVKGRTWMGKDGR